MPAQKITVLGATGSIGLNTLDVVDRYPERYSIYALAALSSVDSMHALCIKHEPVVAVMADLDAATELEKMLRKSGSPVQVKAGQEALEEISSHPEVDIVMAAIVGAAGLRPNLAAAAAGKKVLLANKESLVMSGALFMEQVKHNGSVLLPIDSEHNAIFQCLPQPYECGNSLGSGVRKILLTASGGPFRCHSKSELMSVTPEQACNHPNWSMGRKISVDSASLMNKGLELIEACWLFNLTPSEVDVVVHPQSVVHSMVEYSDGSVLAQMGAPDMRIPIAYGLAYPERVDSGASSLSLTDIGRLEFEEPDLARFPCLGLASQAFDMGGSACAVLNAANEVAVSAFLKGNIAFTVIPDIIEKCLAKVSSSDFGADLAGILDADLWAREQATVVIEETKGRILSGGHVGH